MPALPSEARLQSNSPYRVLADVKTLTEGATLSTDFTVPALAGLR
jgi:hypothetical protein